jgi:hypothetical protein
MIWNKILDILETQIISRTEFHPVSTQLNIKEDFIII